MSTISVTNKIEAFCVIKFKFEIYIKRVHDWLNLSGEFRPPSLEIKTFCKLKRGG